jgi:hypothetical protein
MKEFLLLKVRLSTYFWLCFGIFFVLSVSIPGYKFDAGALTLFSVNSFLYGFYIAPILGAQRSRIEELHRIIRSEANALFSIVLKFKKLPDATREELLKLVITYLRARFRTMKISAGEAEYEALITYCVEYKGTTEHQAQVDKILEAVVSNQQNRTNFSMQAANKVFANEWQIMAILFSITLGFILTISISHTPMLHIIRALLCTGLTMLIINLIKLNTLTHKKARQMWNPFRKLVATNFYRID